MDAIMDAIMDASQPEIVKQTPVAGISINPSWISVYARQPYTHPTHKARTQKFRWWVGGWVDEWVGECVGFVKGP